MIALSSANPSTPVSLREDSLIMALVGLSHASSHFSHLLLPLMFPVFMKEFGWTFSELGLMSSVFFVISGAGQACSGFVVDRFGARPILFASLSLFVLACLTASIATTYPAMLLVAVLAGLGNCAFHPLDFTILNQRISSARIGYAFSVHGLTGSLGWAAAPMFMGLLSTQFGWRTADQAAAVLYLGILALMVLQRDKLATSIASRPFDTPKGQDLAFMRLPVVWWCFVFFLLSTVTLAVVQNFSLPILQALHQVSFEAATLTLTFYMLASAVGILIGGFVASRWPAHSDKVVASCMAGAAVLLGVCASGVMGSMGTMAVLAATGFAVGIGGPSRDLMIKKATPAGATGRVYGLVYSGLDVGFALSPIVFGAFMDRGWYSATLACAALVLLLSVGAALGVGQRTPPNVVPVRG
jgi:MFS family permease